MAQPVPDLDGEGGAAALKAQSAPSMQEVLEVLHEQEPAEPDGEEKAPGEKVHVTVEVPLTEDWWVNNMSVFNMCGYVFLQCFIPEGPPVKKRKLVQPKQETNEMQVLLSAALAHVSGKLFVLLYSLFYLLLGLNWIRSYDDKMKL